MDEYRQRDAMLAKLGFDSYAEYLASDLWAGIKRRVFHRAKLCVICSERATEIHHSSYGISTLLGHTLAHLHPLCNFHHKAIEFTRGVKVSLLEANTKLQGLMAGNGTNPFYAGPTQRQLKAAKREQRKSRRQ